MAVHLEVVSDLTSEAFITCLRRFMARRGKPHTIWSDHGSNFVGASRELAELAAFLEEQRTQTDIPDFCASQSIRWSFIPERAPHFGGLWESAVKSMKLYTSQESCRKHPTDFRRTDHSSYTSGSMPQFQATCLSPQRW